MVVAKRLFRSVISQALMLAILLSVGPQFERAHGQELPPVQLDMPIVPEGMGVAPVPMDSGVPHLPVSDQSVTYPSAPVTSNGAVVGSAIGESTVGTMAAPQVFPTNFTGCTSCGSIGCSGCNQFSGPGFACPPTSIGFWIRSDYLVWYEKDSNTIPLVTTSSGFPADELQVLNLDSAETSVLFGGEAGDNPIDGWRLEAGVWLDASKTRGIMGRYFKVGNRNTSFSAGPTDFQFLGIPFLNTDFGPQLAREDAFNLTVPPSPLRGQASQGQVSVSLRGDVESWEVLGLFLSETGCNYRRDWLVGYRNFGLGESLSLTASTVIVAVDENSQLPLGTTTTFNDEFDVENRFHGLDLGMTGSYHQGAWSMDYLAKIAFGLMTTDLDISGSALTGAPGSITLPLVGGLLSQESNIGSHDDSTFAVIPELNLNLGYGVTPNMDITVGYSFIWVSSIVRAGDGIDRTVDEGFLGDLDPINSNRPGVDFDTDTYFLHGFNFGVTGRF